MTEYLDDKDKKLLKEVQKDCSQSLWQLAVKVGLTPTPCFKRLKSLKNRGVIIGQREKRREEAVAVLGGWLPEPGTGNVLCLPEETD